jgi:hypothetical protein
VWRRRRVGVIGRHDEPDQYDGWCGDDHIWSCIWRDIDGRYVDAVDWLRDQSYGQHGVVYGERGR